MERYNFNYDGLLFTCFWWDGGWQVLGPAPDGGIRAWTDRLTPEAKSGADLLISFINIKNRELQLQFIHEYREYSTGQENARDIKRAHYDSSIGRIILHTKRNGRDVDGFIEIAGKEEVLSYKWEADISGIQPKAISALRYKPF